MNCREPARTAESLPELQRAYHLPLLTRSILPNLFSLQLYCGEPVHSLHSTSCPLPRSFSCSSCFQFDSNPIQNKSPALRTLYLIVSVMQSFEATCWLPKTKHKTILNNSFNVSMTLVIFNVFLERTSFL